MISLASDFSVAAGMLDVDSACAFQSRVVCVFEKSATPHPLQRSSFSCFGCQRKKQDILNY